MKRIGLLSDTHGYIDNQVFTYFQQCDEVWHAGDIGTIQLADQLEAFKPFRAVHGNVDHGDLLHRYPLDLRFECEGVDVWITHIGGYPGKYHPRVRPLLRANPPKLFVTGHSHILKVMPDKELGLLHINPGACGIQGYHIMKTITRFTLENGRISQLEVIELGKRGEKISI
jgi:putative phosphoesterase